MPTFAWRRTEWVSQLVQGDFKQLGMMFKATVEWIHTFEV